MFFDKGEMVCGLFDLKYNLSEIKRNLLIFTDGKLPNGLP
jgi:hypothetical protein